MQVNSYLWKVYAASVRGSSHERAGKPNQDAFACHPMSGSAIDGVAVAAVADGHGNRKCFRSDRGARFAVEIAVSELRASIPDSWSVEAHLSTFKRASEVELPQQIVQAWQARVDEDLSLQPFSDAEQADLTIAERIAVTEDPRTAYGSTLVATLMLPGCALYIQLGDGDVLIADEGAEPARPLPGDKRSFANETASLSTPPASSGGKRPSGAGGPWADFRVMTKIGVPPALVLLSTDGYVNAFVNDTGFRQVAADILHFGNVEGWEYVERELQGWLMEASRQGSGDDVTVALLVRMPASQKSARDVTELSDVVSPAESETL